MDLSIIIPLYNCEQHLPTTFKVLESQEIFNPNIMKAEIILIDDESTDNTLLLAKEFQSKHTNVSVISKKNEGQHIARNIGLDMASGEYIYMMDDDDIMHPGCLKQFLSYAIREKPDVFIFRWKAINPDDINKILSSDTYTDNNHITFNGCGDNFIIQTEGLISQYPIWNKLFRRDFINQFNIRFNKSVIFGEDVAFVWTTFLSAKTVIVVDKIGYYWINNPHNCTNTTNKDKDRGNKRNLSKEQLALCLKELLTKQTGASQKVRDLLAATTDLFLFGYWLFRLKVGCNNIESDSHLERQKDWGIYPISTPFPKTFFAQGYKNLLFRVLWFIISREYLLKACIRFRNVLL